MRLIDKGYAKIFVDEQNEIPSLLKCGMELTDILDESEFVNEYYKSEGLLQWNMYVMVDNNQLNEEQREILDNNDKYVKFLRVNLKSYSPWDYLIKTNFPDFKENHDCSFTLYTNKKIYNSYAHVKQAVDQLNLNPSYHTDSIAREYTSMTTLGIIDALRAEMLEDNEHITFSTHVNWEVSIIKKKFGFLGDKFKVVEV